MAAIVIKNLHRSVTQRAEMSLEESIPLPEGHRRPLPPPFKGRHPLTDKILRQAKRERR
jgi:hypothetical protein